MTQAERQIRSFSDSFKQTKVREIELRQSTVNDIVKQYEVSETSVYRWISKFGKMKNKAVRVVLESQSDTKALLEMKRKIAELERMLGQKQILLDFKDKMIEIAEEMYGVDIKKKLSGKPSDITGTSEKNTPSV